MPTDFTVSLDNRPGTLADLGEALGGAGVNIDAFAGFGLGEAGVAHVLVGDAGKAKAALEGAGIKVTAEKEALSVTLPDEPGVLGAHARKLANAGVNIEASYVGSSGPGGVDVVFVVDDIEKARSA